MERDMASISDPFDLKRFVDAQAPVYGIVVGELRDGRKRSHWMWFVFPQLRGLGYKDVRSSRSSAGQTTSSCAHR
jgi:uncharacterized protein (DUF1810 family)